MHVFPYSERPGTAALKIDGAVVQHEKNRRVAVLNELSEKKLHAFMESMLGTVRPVLWETPRPGGVMHGLTDNYIRVSAPSHPELINEVTAVRLDNFDDSDSDIIHGSLI